MKMKRPDLAGYRIRMPQSPAIFLIDDDGTSRWLPNNQTYNNLFRDWNNIVDSIETDQIDRGPDISDGAILARGVNTPQVYLISNGQKRWVVSNSVMDKLNFSWSAVKDIPLILLEYIPSGPNIT